MKPSELLDQRISERVQAMLSKKELSLIQSYTKEVDEGIRRTLKFKLAGTLTSKYLKVVLEEIGRMSNREFGEYTAELLGPIIKKLSQVGRESVQIEVLRRDPLTVFAEVNGYADLMKKTDKIMNFRIRNVPRERLLTRIIAILYVNNMAYWAFLGTYRPLFEVLQVASGAQMDENWAISSVAVDLEENILKKKCLELGATKEELSGIRYDALVNKTVGLITKGESRKVAMDVFLSSGYRKVRNVLKHEAHSYKPSRDETLKIVDHLVKLNSALWPSAQHQQGN